VVYKKPGEYSVFSLGNPVVVCEVSIGAFVALSDEFMNEVKLSNRKLVNVAGVGVDALIFESEYQHNNRRDFHSDISQLKKPLIPICEIFFAIMPTCVQYHGDVFSGIEDNQPKGCRLSPRLYN